MKTLLPANLKMRLQRLYRYEFWPFWLFYIPLYFYGLWLGLRARSFTYFTATNPDMPWGGVMGISKSAVLRQFDPELLPVTLTVEPQIAEPDLLARLNVAGLNFPLVAKPDVGERGKSVEKINDLPELQTYLAAAPATIILQEFIDLPLELGILYYRLPGETQGRISSVVVRDFLRVTGDGRQTLAELAGAQLRGMHRLDYFARKFGTAWHKVVPANHCILLEPIGNHNRGTAFLSGNHLITPQLERVFDEITRPVQGFYYGRFDLKAGSYAELYEGRNIKLLELNGVASEPAHVYDPGMRLLAAYRDIFSHARTIWQIARANHRRGVAYAPLADFLKALRLHLKTSGKEKRVASVQ